jgi:hypothetical protein
MLSRKEEPVVGKMGWLTEERDRLTLKLILSDVPLDMEEPSLAWKNPG